tara:strand:- start:1058 stop:1609 length:552 start_codon:yes stop_codon:yes gene_type:complete
MTAKKTTKTITMEQIWKELSSINVTKFTQKKNNLSYLPWSDAIALTMEHFPTMTYEFLTWADNSGRVQVVNMIPSDQGWTGIVGVNVTIEDHTKGMLLPIMTGFSNKAVLNPTSRDITDSLMRCLTKCLAMFGLGHHLYTGEELPKDYSAETKTHPMHKMPTIQPVKTHTGDANNTITQLTQE